MPVVDKVGEYGGVWRRAFLGPADANNYVRVVYDALFRFSPDGAKIEPKIAEAAEPSADYKVWTIKLRKGSKWSDGQPFGADDILFWYNDVLLNKELTPTLPGWIKSPDGSAAKVEKVDDNTVRFTYTAPATLFLTAVANQDGADRTFAMFLPAHYLKKFHPDLRAQGRHREDGAGGGLQDLDRAVRQQERAAGESRAADHGGLGAEQPRQRSGVHAEAQSLLRRRRQGRQPAALSSTRCASPTSPTCRRSTWRRSPATSTCRNATSS